MPIFLTAIDGDKELVNFAEVTCATETVMQPKGLIVSSLITLNDG
jgi:hypothetical protein